MSRSVAIGGVSYTPEYINAKAYGVGDTASGAGATDWTAIMRDQLVPLAQSTGKVIVLPPVDVAFNGSIVTDATKSVALVGDRGGATRIIDQNVSTILMSQTGSYNYLGGPGATDASGGIGLAQDVRRNQTTLTFDQVHGLTTTDVAAGCFLDLRDMTQQLTSLWNGSNLGWPGDTVKVARIVDTKTVELIRGPIHPLRKTLTRVRRIIPVKPIVRNLTYVADSPETQANSARPFSWRRTTPLVDNVFAENFRNAVFSLPETIGGKITNVKGTRGRNDLGGGPYFIRIGEGTVGLEIDGLQGEGGRHIITSTGDSNYHLAKLVVVRNGYGKATGSAMFSTHWSAEYWWWFNCVAVGYGSPNDDYADGGLPANDSGHVGFQMRARYQTLQDCRTYGALVGVVAPGTLNPRILGCTFERARVGVWASASDGLEIDQGTQFRDCRDNFVVVDNSGGVTDENPSNTPGPVNIRIRNTEFFGDTINAGIDFQSWDDSNQIDTSSMPFLGPQALTLVDMDGAPSLRLTARKNNVAPLTAAVVDGSSGANNDLVIYQSGVEKERFTHVDADLPGLLTLMRTPVNDVQTISSTATGGSTKWTVSDGTTTEQTAAIPFNAKATFAEDPVNSVEQLLRALTMLTASDISVSGGPLGVAPIVVTFLSTYGGKPMSTIVVDNTSATGGTASVVHTTTGRSASLLTTAELLQGFATPLAVSVTNVATTFTLYETFELPTAGRALIGTELITWTGKTTSTLTGVTRGVGGTTAAAHNAGDILTQAYAPLWSSGYTTNATPKAFSFGHHQPFNGLVTPSLVAAATLLIPRWTNYFRVTGTTGISSIPTDPSMRGRTVTLFFVNGAAITDTGVVGITSPTVANDEVTMFSDGAKWTVLKQANKP